MFIHIFSAKTKNIFVNLKGLSTMVLVPAHQNHGAPTIFRDLFSIVFLQGNKAKKKHRKQDPVSTMQKTGWTIHSSFLVLSSMKPFSCVLGHFRHGDEQTNKRPEPADPRASLLLTSVRGQSFAIFRYVITK